MYLLPRSSEIAAWLPQLDERIRVADDYQHMVDRSDVVVLAARRQIAEEVARSFRFAQRHHIVGIMATIDLGKLRKWLGPIDRITRAIPLLFAAKNAGMTPLYPPDPIVQELIAALGTAIEAQPEAELDLLIASGMMGTSGRGAIAATG